MCRQTAGSNGSPFETGTASGLVRRQETTGLLPRGAADLSGIGRGGAHTRFSDADGDGGSSSGTDQVTTGAAPEASEGPTGGGDGTGACTEAEGSLSVAGESAAVEAGQQASSTMQMKKYWYQRFSLFSRFKEGQ
jgi:hypothetical protein